MIAKLLAAYAGNIIYHLLELNACYVHTWVLITYVVALDVCI